MITDYYTTDTGMKTADATMEFDAIEIKGDSSDVPENKSKLVPALAIGAGIFLAYMLLNKG